MRETFVAVVTSNIPMISPLIARFFRPLIGSLRSLSSSGGGGGGNNKGGGCGSRTPRSKEAQLPRGFHLEDKNPRRGMGPRSVNPIPNFSVNCSDEHIYARNYDDDFDGAGGSGGGAAASYDTDVEAARATRSKGGVIVKQTSVEVIETRNFGEEVGEREDVGDYYLVRQAQREAERLARQASVGKRRRTSSTFGIGRAV